MRTLPERPSLENLRNQAKALLTELRKEDPAAALAAAQGHLAAEHGFRTWADFKTEVERRQREQVVADAGLAAELASTFDLGDVDGPMRLNRRHFREQVWTLSTDRGRWMPKEMAAWFDSDGEADVRLQTAALDAGLRLPRPLRSSGGAVVESVAGSRWRMFEWIDFGPTPPSTQRARLARETGAALAALHALAIPAPAPGPWLTSRPGAGHWAELLDVARRLRPLWLDAFETAVSGFVEVADIVPAGMPGDPILCHSDLGPYNVRQGADGHVLLGWEFAGGQPALWEFGYTVNQWATGRRMEPIARALAAGYAAGGGCVPGGLEMFGSTVPASLNWIRTRIQASLQAEPGSDTKRAADREVSHLLVEPLSLDRLTRLSNAVRV